MSIAPEIKAPTFSEAVNIAHNDPVYNFQNSWQVDHGSKVKRFTYQDIDYVAKRTDVRSASCEVDNAQRAQELLSGSIVGGKLVRAIIPRVEHVADSEHGYVVSEYVGLDANEQYYRGEKTLISLDDFTGLVEIFRDNGISTGSLLPRNIIINQDSIDIIDWERIKFFDRPVAVTHVSQTVITIAWSYFFGLPALLSMHNDVLRIDVDNRQFTSFEKLFSKITGMPLDIARNKSTEMAVSAEADRGYPVTDFKIDDIFHVIGELLPLDAELMLDILFAGLDDEGHKHAAIRGSELYKDLYLAPTAKMGEALTKFKMGCAGFIIGLTGCNPEEGSIQDLADNLTDLTQSLNPDFAVDRRAMLKVANSISNLLY